MKKLLLLCVPLIFSCGENVEKNEDELTMSQEVKTDLEKEGLNGNIKSIRTDEEYTIFNTQGNKTKVFSINHTGEESLKYMYEYNDQIKTGVKHYKSNGDIDWIGVYTYNTDGQLIETTEESPNKDGYQFKQKYKYKYDKIGNLIEKTRESTQGLILGKEEYIYKDQKLIEENIYGPGPQTRLKERRKISYNSEGKKDQIFMLFPPVFQDQDTATFTLSYSYLDGKIKEESNNMLDNIIIYEYDNQDNVIKKIWKDYDFSENIIYEYY